MSITKWSQHLSDAMEVCKIDGHQDETRWRSKVLSYLESAMAIVRNSWPNNLVYQLHGLINSINLFLTGDEAVELIRKLRNEAHNFAAIVTDDSEPRFDFEKQKPPKTAPKKKLKDKSKLPQLNDNTVIRHNVKMKDINELSPRSLARRLNLSNISRFSRRKSSNMQTGGSRDSNQTESSADEEYTAFSKIPKLNNTSIIGNNNNNNNNKKKNKIIGSKKGIRSSTTKAYSSTTNISPIRTRPKTVGKKNKRMFSLSKTQQYGKRPRTEPSNQDSNSGNIGGLFPSVHTHYNPNSTSTMAFKRPIRRIALKQSIMSDPLHPTIHMARSCSALPNIPQLDRDSVIFDSPHNRPGTPGSDFPADGRKLAWMDPISQDSTPPHSPISSSSFGTLSKPSFNLSQELFGSIPKVSNLDAIPNDVQTTVQQHCLNQLFALVRRKVLTSGLLKWKRVTSYCVQFDTVVTVAKQSPRIKYTAYQQHKAALLIQRMTRGLMGRLRVRRIKRAQNAKVMESIITLQRVAKNWLVKIRSEQRQLEKRQLQSTLKIQGLWRSRRVRFDLMNNMRKELQAEWKKFLCDSTLFRGLTKLKGLDFPEIDLLETIREVILSSPEDLPFAAVLDWCDQLLAIETEYAWETHNNEVSIAKSRIEEARRNMLKKQKTKPQTQKLGTTNMTLSIKAKRSTKLPEYEGPPLIDREHINIVASKVLSQLRKACSKRSVLQKYGNPVGAQPSIDMGMATAFMNAAKNSTIGGQGENILASESTITTSTKRTHVPISTMWENGPLRKPDIPYETLSEGLYQPQLITNFVNRLVDNTKSSFDIHPPIQDYPMGSTRCFIALRALRSKRVLWFNHFCFQLRMMLRELITVREYGLPMEMEDYRGRRLREKRIEEEKENKKARVEGSRFVKEKEEAMAEKRRKDMIIREEWRLIKDRKLIVEEDAYSLQRRCEINQYETEARRLKVENNALKKERSLRQKNEMERMQMLAAKRKEDDDDEEN